MLPLFWIGLVAGALCSGAALALVLVVPRSREGLAIFGAVLSILVSAASASMLLAGYDSLTPVIVAALFVIAALGGGFALVSAILAYTRPAIPSITLPTLGDGAGRVLVALVADYELATYHVGEITAEIAELVDAGFPEPSLALTPFHYAAQKARYRAVGGRSPEQASAIALVERLEQLLDRESCIGPVLVRSAYHAALADVLTAAASDGYERIIVAHANVSESYHAQEQRREMEESSRCVSNPRVSHVPALWASDTLAQHVASKTLMVVTDPATTGVALLVHGQPGEQAYVNAGFDVEENAFANRIRMHLIEAGFTESRVRVCSAEWGRPGLTEAVRHLGALGAERIAVVSACYPFANLQTLLDIPGATHDARVPDEVRIVHVPPWGDDPAFAEILAGAVMATIAE